MYRYTFWGIWIGDEQLRFDTRSNTEFNLMASCDVVSNVCQALTRGPSCTAASPMRLRSSWR